MRLAKAAALIVMAIIIAAAPAAVSAQEVGIIQATATVVSGLTVIPSHNLEFGIVTPGVNRSIDKTQVGFAGEWTINGQSSAAGNVKVNVTSALDHASTAAVMPVLFNSTDASYDDETGGGQTSPTAAINPALISTVNLGAGGSLMVWIGGQANPTVSQSGGSYSGDIELTVTLTGN